MNDPLILSRVEVRQRFLDLLPHQCRAVHQQNLVQRAVLLVGSQPGRTLGIILNRQPCVGISAGNGGCGGRRCCSGGRTVGGRHCGGRRVEEIAESVAWSALVQYGSERQLTGLTDHTQSLLLIGNSRELNQHVAVTGNLNLGFLHSPDGFDPAPHHLDGLREHIRIGRFGGTENHRGSSLQVKSQFGRGVVGQRQSETSPGDRQDHRERDDALAHQSWDTFVAIARLLNLREPFSTSMTTPSSSIRRTDPKIPPTVCT